MIFEGWDGTRLKDIIQRLDDVIQITEFS